MASSTGQSPTAVRRALGSRLKEIRENHQMTVAQAADASGLGKSTITKVELARMVPSLKTAQALVGAYPSIDDDERDRLLSMARAAAGKEWWEMHGTDVPDQFDVYLGLEQLATTIEAYDNTWVNGLLQTPDYARALIKGVQQHLPGRSLQQRVEMRMRRQEILTRKDSPLELWWVADEAVLRRHVGGPETMYAQLQHLIECSAMRNVHILVIPNTVGAYPAMDGPFAILHFEAGQNQTVYVESQAGNLYLERSADLKRCQSTMRLTIAEAPGPETSLALLQQIAKEIKP